MKNGFSNSSSGRTRMNTRWPEKNILGKPTANGDRVDAVLRGNNVATRDHFCRNICRYKDIYQNLLVFHLTKRLLSFSWRLILQLCATSSVVVPRVFFTLTSRITFLMCLLRSFASGFISTSTALHLGLIYLVSWRLSFFSERFLPGFSPYFTRIMFLYLGPF